MKKRVKLPLLLLVLLFGVFFTSCKKKVAPSLIIHVEDYQGKPLPNITVYSHPCFDGGCDTIRLSEDFIKEKLSDENGEVIYEFPYSSVLDIIAKQAITDPAGETLYFKVVRNVVAIETKELKKGEKNEFETFIIFPED